MKNWEKCGSAITRKYKVQLENKKNKKMLLRNAYRRNPLVLGLHETIDRYMKLVLQKQHAFEQVFFIYTSLLFNHIRAHPQETMVAKMASIVFGGGQ